MTIQRTILIEPGRAERNYWSDLWHYRELFAILAWRDVAVRYKQTVIGVAWAFIRPFLTMVVFTVVFGKLAKLPSDGDAPYPVLVFAGMLPWFLFSSILSEASNSLVGNANLISKVYFPRLIVPASAGRRGAGRFRDQSCHSFRDHGLVWLLAELAHRVPAGFRAAGRAGEPGAGAATSRRST